MRTGIATSVDHTQSMTPRFYPIPAFSRSQSRIPWNLFIESCYEQIGL